MGTTFGGASARSPTEAGVISPTQRWLTRVVFQERERLSYALIWTVNHLSVESALNFSSGALIKGSAPRQNLKKQDPASGRIIEAIRLSNQIIKWM